MKDDSLFNKQCQIYCLSEFYFGGVEENTSCYYFIIFCSQLQQPGAGGFSSCPATPPGGSMLHSKSPPLPSLHHAGAPPLPSFPTASSAAAAAVILQQHSAGEIISFKEYRNSARHWNSDRYYFALENRISVQMDLSPIQPDELIIKWLIILVRISG